MTESGAFCPHLGAAAKAGFFTVDLAHRRIIQTATVVPPNPEPCGWADWLGARGVKVLLAGAMGQRALHRMAAAGIDVVPGTRADVPVLLVQAWLNQEPNPGPNGCRRGPRAAEDGCCCTSNLQRPSL